MYEAKKEKLRDVFLGKSDYIPLSIRLNCEPSPHGMFDRMTDPVKALEAEENQWNSARLIESDMIPFVESNFLECLIPSIFGAKSYRAPGDLIDVHPIFDDIYETEDVSVDNIFTGEMENALRHLEYLKNNAPDDVYVAPSRQLSPLDAAVVMRGGDFYMDLLEEPELSEEFMKKISDVTICVLKELKKVTGQPMNECVTPRGFLFPGIRLTGDAIVNISGNMIKEIMCEQYKVYEKEFGNVMLHYCCTPAPSTHVIGALAEGGGVICADNWQGYRTMVGDNTFVKGIGICTDVSKEDILSGKIFDDPFFTFRQRPLTVSVNVDTIDEGKRIYELWQEKMN